MVLRLLERPALLFPVIALAVLAAYSTMLNGEFKTMDDNYCIVQNADLRSVQNVPKIFSQSFFGVGAYYRPLVTLTYLAEYQLFGLNAFYFYLDNLALHALCAALVFLIIAEVSGRRRRAAAAALLFAIHPVQWEAVANISGRAILLSAFFGLAAVAAFLRGQHGRRGWLALSAGCFVLAMFSKESAAMVPLVLASALVFLGGRDAKRRPAAASDWAALVPFGVVIGLYLFLRVRLGITRTFPWPNLEMAALGTLSFLRSLLTHLRLLVFPVGLRFDRASRLFLSFADPELLATAAVWLGLAAALWKARARIPRPEAFFLSWFAVELLPVSQLVTTIGVQPGYISAADHFLYLPSAAFLALLVTGAEKLCAVSVRRRVLSRTALGWLAAGSTAFFFLLTLGHNYTAGSEFAMFERTLAGDPGNIRVRYNLAQAYARRGRYDEAERHFRDITVRLPTMTNAWIGLGKALCDQGKFWEGIRIWEGIRTDGPSAALVRDNLERTYRYLRGVYEKQSRDRPQEAALQQTLGVVRAKTGDLDGALACFARAVELEPGFRDALFNLASAQEAKGDLKGAAASYRRFLDLAGEDNGPGDGSPDGTKGAPADALDAIARERWQALLTPAPGSAETFAP